MNPCSAKEKYNVLLVTVDSLRADFLGCYSHRWASGKSSPNIDRWTQGGLMFSRAITQSTHTSPAFLAMLSGNYASKYGDWFDRPVSKNRLLLAEIFRNNGYTTYAFNSNPYISHYYHFDRGFDLFIDNIPLRRKKAVSRALLSTMAKLKAIVGEPYENAEHINSQAIAKLQQVKTPYFIWVHYMDVHGPYIKKKGWRLKNALRGSYIWKKALRTPGSITEREQMSVVESYIEEIQYLDAHFDKLLSHIDGNTTVVIFTADHGDLFGEHGVFGHSTTLYEGVLHVPLIIKVPPKLGSCGKQIQEPIALIDLVPTLVDLLDLRTDGTFDGGGFSSLIQEAEHSYRRKFIISELSRKFLCVEKEGWKFIVNNKTGHRELYNIAADPSETYNLVADHRSLTQELEEIINEHVRRNKLDGAAREAMAYTDEMKARLKALGYMD